MDEIKEGFSYSGEDPRGIKYDSKNDIFVDTNDRTNPTLSYIFVDRDKIPVWSIFLRKENGIYGDDGNPLLYALKGEKNWHFYPNERERAKFITQIDRILKNFLSFFPLDLTVVVPSSNDLNYLIARRIKALRPNAEIITDVLRKLKTEEVRDAIHKDNSKFNEIFGGSEKRLRDAFNVIDNAIIKMNNKHNGYFTYHELPFKGRYREAITDVLAYNEKTKDYYTKEIFNRDILVIDDSIASGATIINACRILKDFGPKTISVLTLFSEKTGKMPPNTDHMSWKTALKMNESEDISINKIIPDNEIWYISTDGYVVYPETIGQPDDIQIVSNEYFGDHGVIKFKKPITSLWEEAFKGLDNLKGIYLPKTLKYINKQVFARCRNLERVYGSENIMRFGASSFYLSGIKEIYINANAQISNFAFADCKKLEMIYLFGLSQSIGNLVFGGCDNLNMVYVESSSAIDINRTNIKEILYDKFNGKWHESEIRQIIGKVNKNRHLI